MIDKIIQLEWEWFENVRHIDGRAECQNDHETFYLQRKAQFLGYSDELLNSYYHDLVNARNIGRNPIMEKYAYMMESTDTEYFKKIQPQLPLIDDEKKQLVNMICDIEVMMREEVNQKYPGLAKQARIIYTKDDTVDSISFETYLRGELYTYSPHSLWLYGQMVVEALQQGHNIVEEILERTVRLYGYLSLESANEHYL